MTVEGGRDVESRRFMTTQWTHVLAARGDSQQAKESLKALCERYYAPVHSFIQNYTRHNQNASDWTQAFFAKILEGGSLDCAHQSKGKFRSYLLGAVKHFLSDEREKRLALKRGGSLVHVAMDSAIEVFVVENATCDMASLDAYFDRQWALSILHVSLSDLQSELEPAQLSRFELLHPWLSGDPVELSLKQVGVKLGMSEEAIKVTLHRFRKRFREIVKSHIAATLSDADDVDEELRYLIEALASSSSPSEP